MRLIREGHSFSGRERNCAFLNMGGTKFANVSSVAGLDFIDDGRALALMDWDFDGDLDIWYRNRTGPRMRLMRNDTNTVGQADNSSFVAFKLQGTTCNRDAIGARVEVKLKDTSAGKLIQTLYAGDGYISQSTKWLHFGLGKDGSGNKAEIDSVVIQWPDRKVEQFENIQPDRYYQIVQGSGQAVEKSMISPKTLMPSKQISPKNPGSARVVLSSRFPLPIMRYTALNDTKPKQSKQVQGKSKPTLVIFWASWCMPCIEELNALKKKQSKLQALDVNILALSVDGLDPKMATTPADAKRLLEQINFPYDSGVATIEALEKLALAQRVVLNDVPEFAVPYSLLLDRNGEVAIMYRGKVDPKILINDISKIDGPIEKRRDLAIPFDGVWVSPAKFLRLAEVARLFKDEGYSEDYTYFLEKEIENRQKRHGGITSDSERVRIDSETAGMHVKLGSQLFMEGNHEAAFENFQKALEINPEYFEAHYALGVLYATKELPDKASAHYKKALEIQSDSEKAHIQLAKILKSQGKVDEAISHYNEALAKNSDNEQAHYHLAVALMAKRNPMGALKHYQEALRIKPNFTEAHANMGVVLASQKKFDEAISHIRQALEAEPDNASFLFNLGLALGSLGKFDEAIVNFRKSATLAPDDFKVHAKLGQALLRINKPQEAIKHLEKAIQINPRDFPSANILAWLLATSTMDDIRNGARAVELAEQLCKATGYKNATVLVTLAAAQAEQGNFVEAIATLDKAQELVGAGSQGVEKNIQKYLELFRAGQPVRE